MSLDMDVGNMVLLATYYLYIYIFEYHVTDLL